MKVKVSRKITNNQTVEEILHQSLSSAYEEIEKLFQENKDLRVQEGHTQDEIKQLKSRLATACADRDNFEASFKQMTSWWEQATKAKVKAEEQAEEYRIALMESDCRVDECEKRMDWLSKEVLEWKTTAEDYKNQYEGLRETTDNLSAKVKTYESTFTWAKLNAAQEEVARLQKEIARLTTERDTIVKENSDLYFRNSELEDELTAAVNLKNEYAEQAGELRKQLNVKDSARNFWNFLVEYGLVKTEEELGGNHNEIEH